jgi:hypothetical protein
VRLLPGMKGTANFRGSHRMWLTRRPVDMDDAIRDFALWVGMNPSTAGADEDDMTVRKDIGFTRELGFTAYVKVNVATLIETDPDRLRGLDSYILRHPDNLDVIESFARNAQVVVLSTGALPLAWKGMLDETVAILTASSKPMLCLGRTVGGWTRHSSRIGYDTAFEVFA